MLDAADRSHPERAIGAPTRTLRSPDSPAFDRGEALLSIAIDIPTPDHLGLDPDTKHAVMVLDARTTADLDASWHPQRDRPQIVDDDRGPRVFA
jgi:hypothetical protein